MSPRSRLGCHCSKAAWSRPKRSIPTNNSLLAIKTLRRVIIAGYEFPHREKSVAELWTALRHHFVHFLARTQSGRGLDGKCRQYCEQHLKQIAKFHLSMAMKHPQAFVLLPGSLDLVRTYWDVIETLGKEWAGSTSSPHFRNRHRRRSGADSDSP